jgi:hypothetical protein
VDRKLLLALAPAVFFAVSIETDSGARIAGAGIAAVGITSVSVAVGFGTAIPTDILLGSWALERGANATVASTALRTTIDLVTVISCIDLFNGWWKYFM